MTPATAGRKFWHEKNVPVLSYKQSRFLEIQGAVRCHPLKQSCAIWCSKKEQRVQSNLLRMHTQFLLWVHTSVSIYVSIKFPLNAGRYARHSFRCARSDKLWKVERKTVAILQYPSCGSISIHHWTLTEFKHPSLIRDKCLQLQHTLQLIKEKTIELKVNASHLVCCEQCSRFPPVVRSRTELSHVHSSECSQESLDRDNQT